MSVWMWMTITVQAEPFNSILADDWLANCVDIPGIPLGLLQCWECCDVKAA